uniref:Uncharacterized protein n=1 Tax=Myripristis murdjan TaxID=586833 RepID=A0A668ATX7_9TELE
QMPAFQRKIWGPDHGGPALCQRGWAVNCGTFNTPIPLPPEGNLLWARGCLEEQEMDDMLRFEKKNEEKKWKVYTYEKAVERYCTIPSAHILLERGLAQVEGGLCYIQPVQCIYVLYSCFHKKHNPYAAVWSCSRGYTLSSCCFVRHCCTFNTNLQCICIDAHTVVTVPGDHHVHLNSPEIVAPFVCDFLQSKVLSQPPSPADSQTAKL